MTRPDFVHLSDHGISVLLDARGRGLPAVLHWGASLGDLSPADLTAAADALARQTPPGTLDAAAQLTLLPVEGDGFSGRPAVQLRQGGVELRVRWQVTAIEVEGGGCEVVARDEDAGVQLRSRLKIAAGGVVWVTHTLRRDAAATPPDAIDTARSGGGSAPASRFAGDDAIIVDHLEATLPVPDSTSHATTLTGRWAREKQASITKIAAGATTRTSRRGRPGHDAPLITALSEGTPRWDDGRIWAVHTAWSADTTYRIDRITDQVTLLGAGELLRPGEISLGAGDEYSTPPTAFVATAGGLDGVAHALHTWLRARSTHPTTPRPFTLNTWEAVYFDQDPAQLQRLAERAAAVGVERFVLDDGWFVGRRDDTTSLGDWSVDPAIWPDGLRPLAARVHELGMQFGLWFEPEMISLDSELAHRHPDWLLHDPRHLDHDPGLSWRTQFVLDLANPDAWAHILDRISTLVAEIGIDYIKWDHNRDLVEAVHGADTRGRPGVHAQTVAVYRLIAELKSRHPGLEIESCSSGGARTDLGIMAVCDRVWASDSNDPVERQDIQRWTGLLLPPELVGAHVGPTRSHSSGRVTDLSYRFATSLMGSAGLEWDILSCDDDETAAITRFAALYKELRPLIHRAKTVHPVLNDPAWRATGFVAHDASDAVVVVATVAGVNDARAERLRLPALDAARRYRVRLRREIGPTESGWILPPWFTADETVLPGAFLREVGLQLPTLWPLQAFVLQLTAVD